MASRPRARHRKVGASSGRLRMESSLEDQRRCRTCGRPRGENIAEGTRCARCGQRHAPSCGWRPRSRPVSGPSSTVAARRRPDRRGCDIRLLVRRRSLSAVLFTSCVTRLPAGFSVRPFRGSLLAKGARCALRPRSGIRVRLGDCLATGLATTMDLRTRRLSGAHDRRCCFARPSVSLAIGETVWRRPPIGPFPLRMPHALCVGSLALGRSRSCPSPTFGGRIWSDLAAARYLWRATDDEVVEHMLLSAQDRLAILLERRENAAALATARAALSVAPETPLAHSLLAFTLLHTGQLDESRRVARAALNGMIDDESRTYLTRLADEAERRANSGRPHDGREFRSPSHRPHAGISVVRHVRRGALARVDAVSAQRSPPRERAAHDGLARPGSTAEVSPPRCAGP